VIGATDTLLRFVTPKPDFLGDDARPTWRALEPSTFDKASAPIRVSVWNLAFCSAMEARTAWNRPGYAEFTLRASDVSEASEQWRMPAVRVVEHPLPEHGVAGRAHCGIEGLEKQAGEGKSYGARLSFLASRLQPYAE
jgi:hypothetical protein